MGQFGSKGGLWRITPIKSEQRLPAATALPPRPKTTLPGSESAKSA